MGQAVNAAAGARGRAFLVAERTALNFAMGMFYLFGYGFVNAANARRDAGAFLDLALPGEPSLPLVPAFVWLYCVPFAMIGVAMFAGPLEDRRRFHRVVGVMTLNVAISFAFFLLLPTEMRYRADLSARPDSPAVRMIALFYAWDRPFNCFPSMHVSLNVLAAYVLAELWPRRRALLWTLAALVMVSVVMIKQHYIADAAGGFVLASALYFTLVRRPSGGREAGGSVPSRAT